MQVFISWSGERSRLVAELLNDWLSNVIQHLKTWYSPTMDRGTVWFNDIFNALAESSTGIICLTKENLNNPWILFESGAIAKGVTSNRVYTLTIDIEPEAIKPPLGQFNATKPTREDMLKLIESINKFGEREALDANKLHCAFDAFWPQFEKRFQEIIDTTDAEPIPSPQRSVNEMLTEILDIVRGLARDSISGGTPNYFSDELLNPFLIHYNQNPYEPFCINGSYISEKDLNNQIKQSLSNAFSRQRAQRKISKSHNIEKNANSDLPDSQDDGTAEISK